MRKTTAILLAATLLSCRGGKDKESQYKTEKVDRGNITMTVTATGTASAVTTVQVGSQVSGVIARLYADFNSRVTKGQLLAELDPTPFQAQVEQRQADVTKARVEAANAKITYERQRRLVGAGLSAQADLDAARAQYEAANAGVQQTNAALEQSQTNLRYTKIVSPIDGIVVDRQYDVGQTVAASFQAPTLFSIAQDLTKMQVQADVDQSDIGRVQVGQPARFTVDAYPDEEFRGRISQIRLNAQVNQNVVSYPVIIEVPNPGERLRPKMTANVTIDVATVANVLRIPNASLRFKPSDPKDVAGGEKAAAAASEQQREAQTASAGGGSAPSPDQTAQRMGQRRRGFGGAAGAMEAGGFGGGEPRVKPKRPQTVYLLQEDKKLHPVQVRTGITDGRFTEVVDGGVKIGDQIAVGIATSKVEGPAAFGGQSGGPGGRPGGGIGGGGGGRGPR
ncbi:MAG: efflux RND transporter periplasmic adaptor subunit [Acidobacteria bacterium]|nr:efflux RND transporter periplasmic adaptor subunit [Acidobacteriota bacterium]